MAKLNHKIRQKRREKLSVLHRERRDALKKVIADQNVDMDEKLAAVRKLSEMPRDGSRTRSKSRCKLTGRARAYMRRFALSRIKFRELALSGMLPGITKASW